MAFHSTHRKGYQSCVFEGGQCNFWVLLHCDDRRSPWWASRDGPQHDRSRSDTVIVGMDFKSYAGFAMFSIIPFFMFCFEHEHYMSVGCVWFLSPNVSLQTFKLTLSISFLFEDFRLCPRYNNVNYGAWHVYKPLFGSFVDICRLVCSEISLSINEKKVREKFRKWSDSTNWEMAWQLRLSSGFYNLIEQLFQPMTVRVIFELYCEWFSMTGKLIAQCTYCGSLCTTTCRTRYTEKYQEITSEWGSFYCCQITQCKLCKVES